MWRIEIWNGQTLVVVRVIEAEQYYLSDHERQHIFRNKQGIVCIIASIPGMVVTRMEEKDGQ